MCLIPHPLEGGRREKRGRKAGGWGLPLEWQTVPGWHVNQRKGKINQKTKPRPWCVDGGRLPYSTGQTPACPALLAPESCTHTHPSHPASRTGQGPGPLLPSVLAVGSVVLSLCALQFPESQGLERGQEGSAQVSVHLRTRGRSGPSEVSAGTPAWEGQGPEADTTSHPARRGGLEPAPALGKDRAPH